MAGRFREDEEELESGMPGSPESISIIDKLRNMAPDMEDVKQVVPIIDQYKKSALENLSGLKDSFIGGLDKFEKEYNALTPEQKTEQALGMAMGSVGGLGKVGNVLKTEVPVRFRQILNSPKMSGIIDEVAPFLKGKESLAGKLPTSSPEITQLKNALNQHYNELGPSHQTTQILQKLLSRYSR